MGEPEAPKAEGDVAPAPAGDQPSVAPSMAKEGMEEGGLNVPLLVIGAVGLGILLLCGVFFLLPFNKSMDDGGDKKPGPGDKTDSAGPGGTSGGPDLSKLTYYGVRIGDLESREHGVSGKVYAATEKLICLVDFSYDGAGSAAVFMVGTTDNPDENGEVLQAGQAVARSAGPQRLQAENLRKYTNERVILKPSKPIQDYKYFSVFSKDKKASYGDVKIENFHPPAEMDLGTLMNTGHGAGSDKNTLLDSTRLQIKGLRFDGTAPATFFTVGKGKIEGSSAIKIQQEVLKEYQGEDIELSLPEGKTWDQYEWFSLFCFVANQDFGNLQIPSADTLTVPVYFKGGSRQRRRAVQRRARLGNLSVRAESAVHFNDSSRRRRTMHRRVRLGNPSLKADSGKPKLLACTFGEFGVKRAMVPSDGLCDIVFYTDVEYDTDKNTIASTDGGPAFTMLKSAAKKYTKTTFGTSMSTGSIINAMKDKLPQLKASMDLLFRARFIHFGMLNVENIEHYDTLKGSDLRYLKVVDDFLKKKVPHGHYHSALGISLRDGSKGDAIFDAVKRASDDFPGLTMIVVKLHTDGVLGGRDHWPVAPNPDDVDLSEHKALSLALIKDEAKKQLLDVARHGRYAMLSFAMYARTYRMKANWSDGSVREASESSLNMEYPAVCKMKAEKDSSDARTMYAADQHKKLLALFDTPATFKAKTKARLRVMPSNFTGMVVYNVETDDYKGTCGKGRFPLLKAIKDGLAA